MMFTTWNITSMTFQGSCHIKDTKLCNEEKRAKPLTPRYLIKKLNKKITKNNQTNLSRENSSNLWK
jgi:hypothetical protein